MSSWESLVKSHVLSDTTKEDILEDSVGESRLNKHAALYPCSQIEELSNLDEVKKKEMNKLTSPLRLEHVLNLMKKDDDDWEKINGSIWNAVKDNEEKVKLK